MNVFKVDMKFKHWFGKILYAQVSDDSLIYLSTADDIQDTASRLFAKLGLDDRDSFDKRMSQTIVNVIIEESGMLCLPDELSISIKGTEPLIYEDSGQLIVSIK